MESTESRTVSSVDVGKDLRPIILEDAPKLNPEEIKNDKYVGQEKIEHQTQQFIGCLRMNVAMKSSTPQIQDTFLLKQMSSRN